MEVKMNKRIITNEILNNFKNNLLLQEKAIATIDKYVRDVKIFMNYVGDREINKEIVMNYKEYLKNNKAVRSINSMLASINNLFNYLGWNDLKIKSLKIQQQIFCDEKKELTKEEYFRLCNAAKRNNNERLNLILQTICSTGIRVSELDYITVEAVKRGEAVVSLKGKTRTILIVNDLKKKLLSYATKKNIISGMIFITKTGKPLSRTNIWREMKAVCEDANVNQQKVFPHNLRHLFARIFYGIEKDIAKLADILGHSSINTTRIYIISTGQEHRKKMESMHLII